MSPQTFVIPNFVDCDVFRPVRHAEERTAVRKRLGLTGDALVYGCGGAVKRHHKLIDFLLREYTEFLHGQCDGKGPSSEPWLFVIGSRTPDTEMLLQMAETLAPGRVRFLTDQARSEMPSLLQVLDVFVLPSLFEMMPIAVLEAMATGLPVIVHRHPVLEWMAGPDSCVEMDKPGALARALRLAMSIDWRLENGRRMRDRAERMFNKPVILDQIIRMYEDVKLPAVPTPGGRDVVSERNPP